jgi:hypothetical protein
MGLTNMYIQNTALLRCVDIIHKGRSWAKSRSTSEKTQIVRHSTRQRACVSQNVGLMNVDIKCGAFQIKGD